MRASFTTTPDLRTYSAVEPRHSLFERNPKLNAMQGPLRKAAEDTLEMRFDVPDAAPTNRVNEIVWGLVRGWLEPYPEVRQSVFSPYAVNLDDAEREWWKR
jgi:hypothetical protein